MPKGLRKFHFAFEATGLTRWGGLSLFAQFCKSLGLRRFLQHHVRWPAYCHRSYQPVDLFLSHVFAIVAGIGRIENTQSLIHNGLIPPILGLPEFPHRDTLRTFLWRFGPMDLANLQAAHDRFRKLLYTHLGIQYSAVIDADTTSLITYGNQEGTAVGYLPKRRHGKRSYAPILSSEGRSGLSLGMELRSGNVTANTGSWHFLRKILNKLPSSIARSRTRLRLDAAFYDKAIILPIDAESIGYVVVADITSPLRTRILEAHYTEFATGWEVAEFSYTPFHWQKEHRFVAIRRPLSFTPKDIQERLFTVQNYTYRRVLVTNIELTPPAIYRFYCARAFQELLMREFKNSFFMAKIPTRSFWANAAYMEIILWAYDLTLAFQYFCLPKGAKEWNMSTLRRELWWLPAEWIKRGNRNVLRLPQRYHQQGLFMKIQRTVLSMAPII